MTVVVQEFDGFFTHNIQIEENTSTYEIPCHSKIRKLVILSNYPLEFNVAQFVVNS